MARSVYFSHGTKNEQYLLEDLIIESIHLWGVEFFYIPRILVGKDEILGEDRLSQFKNAYPIEMYMENVDGYEGQGAFIQKFGLMIEQTATLTVARRRWEQLVGRFGQTILPNRPCEGDLIYFPLSKALFEIKYVESQDPFYQLGKLYVYRLSVELFQYGSEKIDTGIKSIDVFETLKSMDMEQTDDPDFPQSYGDNAKLKEEAKGVLFDTSNPFGDIVLSTYTVDSATISVDSTTLTVDRE